MSPSRYGEALEPADLHLLQRVFDRICMERSLSPDTAEAEAMAATLVRLWQSGQRNEETLHTVAGGEVKKAADGRHR